MLFSVIMITMLSMLILLFEWPQINNGYRREVFSLLGITFLGWGVSVFLIFFPEAPGPTEWIDLLIFLFRR